MIKAQVPVPPRLQARSRPSPSVRPSRARRHTAQAPALYTGWWRCRLGHIRRWQPPIHPAAGPASGPGFSVRRAPSFAQPSTMFRSRLVWLSLVSAAIAVLAATGKMPPFAAVRLCFPPTPCSAAAAEPRAAAANAPRLITPFPTCCTHERRRRSTGPRCRPSVPAEQLRPAGGRLRRRRKLPGHPKLHHSLRR